ncbi:MAG: FAD-binding oxidoreductase [Myxococcales bacterium]|nr:FAD-binding oxidoreductase [Myxococcales bacterium]
MHSSTARLEALVAAFGSDLISTDPSDLIELGRDWTRVHTPAPLAIALPRSAAEVAALMRFCDAHDLKVVPSGGRTGLAAGAVAASGELVISLSRMRAMAPVDRLGNTVRVEAGAVTAAVHAHCAEVGLTWPVDFASKGSSQVGGNIATNAGGVKVIRYGLTRNWVLGLEVVTAQGEILSLNGALEKNNTGTDLRQLFIGSEGTLGIITAATLKLVALPRRHDVMIFAVPDVAAVVRLFRAVREAPMVLSAFEFFSEACRLRVERHRHLRPPFDGRYAYYVLVEFENSDRDAVETWAAGLFEGDLVEDGVVAQDASQGAAFWALRESISESLSGTGFPYKNDIALPIAGLEAFVDALEALLLRGYPAFEVCLFGHLGDGNLHVNLMKPDAMSREAFIAAAKVCDQSMFALVEAHRGSVSAEHGIGLLKRDALRFSRSPAELAMLRAVKRALDPKNLLNPGKVFDLDQ